MTSSRLPTYCYLALLCGGGCNQSSDLGVARLGDAGMDGIDPLAVECSDLQPRYAEKVETATRSPDGKGWCCQRGTPTCDCGYFGGFVEDRCDCARTPGTVFGTCDLAPPDWISVTDAHGCSAYRSRSPLTACCNCPRPRDAG